MASPEVLNFTKLLAPIPGEKPVGADLRKDISPTSPYYKVRDARKAAREAERRIATAQDAADNRDPPDWKPVLEHGTAILTEKTKDLEIAAYVIESLARLKGFPGLRDGFRLTRELIEKYWDGLYPLPDEEGLETRVTHLTGLNGEDAEGTLPGPILRIPLTENTSVGRLFGAADYQSALDLSKVADPKARDKREQQGAVNLDKFKKAIAETSSKFFGELEQDIKQCADEFGKLCAALDKRCNGQAPPAGNIRAALTACLDVLNSEAKDKIAQAAAVAAPKPDGAPAPKDGQAAGPAAKASGAVQADVLQTREDAFKTLLKVAEFFRRTEPHSPVSYALEQVVSWGKMTLPDLLAELIPEEAPRKSLFKQVGIKPAAPAKPAAPPGK
jgi:type VI secretion system protein ImpA